MLIAEQLTEQIIGSAMEVHCEVGAGLLESAYCAFLAREFDLRGIKYRREVALPAEYKGVRVECGYRIDFIVEEQVIVEVKAVEKLIPVFSAQLMTYLKLTRMKVGLLLNFNVPTLKDGIIRRVL
jgi:GxxExxY protein